MLRIRPLPGVVFRAESPTLPTLPRMDIAGFVGFASRGPVNIPVAVEDYPQFEDLFGGTYALAWDDEQAIGQTACLAPAVKSFFAQGGRRCWIVRLAGPRAVANTFPLAGLLQTTPGGYQGVAAAARSAGSWSDALQVGAGILLDVLAFQVTAIQPGQAFRLEFAPLQGQPVIPGDLLQIDCADGLHRAYIALQAGDIVASRARVEIIADPQRTFWFRRIDASRETSLAGTAQTVSPITAASTAGTLNVAAATLSANFELLGSQPGDWLLLETASQRVWLLLNDVQPAQARISAAWAEAGVSIPVQGIARLRRVQMTLQAREAEGLYRSLPNLGFAAPHPRFVGTLPDDETLFARPVGAMPELNPASLRDELRYPRFPLSVALDEATVVLPLGLEASPVWRRALPQAGDPVDSLPLMRDGLVPADAALPEAPTSAEWAAFFASLHIDENLRYTGQRALAAEADDLIYFQGVALTGMHALMPIEEISLIALPDAAQRGWALIEQEAAPTAPPPPESPPPPPEECVPPPPFAPRPLEVPPAEPGPTFEALPEIAPRLVWQQIASGGYDDAGLLEVQRAAAIMAAAQADRMVVLGMPKHYRSSDALLHQRKLAADLRTAEETTDSFAALYHPWMIARDTNGDLLHCDPSGGVCGVIAARSIARGAWVPPANEPLRGVLGVTPKLQPGDDAAYFSAGINMIWQAARNFTVWGAYTQSLDAELEDINVRRLLILLRRLALREGQTYVFEPHTDTFRRHVKHQFERILARLFTQGAFAGAEPSSAYRVVIDETLNTQASIEQGRFIVELRVAPSQPLTFITVRLIQTESGRLAVQEATPNG